MIEIKIYETDLGHNYVEMYLDSLKDKKAKSIILRSIDRMEVGLLGDVKSLQGGLQEYRIHYGEGHRIYFYRDGQTLIILLSASNKKNQRREIERARGCLSDYLRKEEEKNEKIK